jgi:uncharacterized protein (DUF1330 family)
MKKQGIKIIIFSVLAIAITGVLSAYLLYNKKHLDVQSADAIHVSAGELYKTFITDSTAAKKNFDGKILLVSGVVTSVSKNQQNQPIVLLKTDSDGASINCTMEGSLDNNRAPGSHISIKGICNGIGQGDADLGIAGDVYLIRSYTSK